MVTRGPVVKKLIATSCIVAVGAWGLVVPTVAAAYTCAGIPVTKVGTPGNDVIYGTAGRDVIAGLSGSDRILGGGGNDLLCGGDGNDAVFAGDGNDVVYAGDGADVVYGGRGSDTLRGEGSRDLLDGQAGSNIAVGGSAIDTCLRAAEVANDCEPAWLGLEFEPVVNSYMYEELYSDISGARYRGNYYADIWDEVGEAEEIQFDLGRDYRMLTATLGLRDDTEDPTLVVRAEIFGDGVSPLWSAEMRFGESFPVRIDVTNVLRLRVRFTIVARSCWCDHYVVLGSPVVSANSNLKVQGPVG